MKPAGAWAAGRLSFRQTVWANIWDAVLAGSWPYPVGIPLAERGPVPEVLLSHLPMKTWIIPVFQDLSSVHAGLVGVFLARD